MKAAKCPVYLVQLTRELPLVMDGVLISTMPAGLQKFLTLKQAFSWCENVNRNHGHETAVFKGKAEVSIEAYRGLRERRGR